MELKIVIIDGQGGMLGKQIVSGIKELGLDIAIVAVGTNSIATSTMLKAGANEGATGENAAIVAARKADVIVGPVGIVVADALMGEITPNMARAVGQSDAVKVLIPVNRCNTLVAGVGKESTKNLIEDALQLIKEVFDTKKYN